MKRGGGIVTLHDSLCGPDPGYFSSELVGGAKKHNEVNYTLEANVPYTIVDKDSPIMKGMTDMTIKDEAFFNMTWAKSPAIHVLATAVIDGTPSAGAHKGEVVPQIWTYEHTLPGEIPLSRVCVDAGTLLRELFQPSAPKHGAPRYRVDRKEACGRVGRLQSPATAPTSSSHGFLPLP